MSYKEEAGSSTLAVLLKRFDLVFMDTCSLMEESFPLFMDYLVGSRYYLKTAYGKTPEFILVDAVINELKNHAANRDDEEKKINALRALKIIADDQRAFKGTRVFTLEKKSDADFADPVIKARVTELKIKNKILVVTQDRMLTDGIKSTNNDPSQRGRFVEVYRINSHSELEINFGERKTPSIEQPRLTPAKTTSAKSLEKTSPKPQPKSDSLSKEAQKAKNADLLLRSNLTNPNYPFDRKIADIDSQIECLNALSPKEVDSLRLSFDVNSLIVRKAVLLDSQKTAAANQTAAKPQKEPQPAVTKSDAKSSPRKEVENSSAQPKPSVLKAKRSTSSSKAISISAKDEGKTTTSPTAKKRQPKPKPSAESENQVVIGNEGNSVAPEGVSLHVGAPKAKEAKPTSAEKTPRKQTRKASNATQKASDTTAEAKTATSGKKRSRKADGAASSALNDVKKSESRLKANLSNPNYPNDKKLADIDAHLNKLSALSDEERSSLTLNVDALKAKESEIKGS